MKLLIALGLSTIVSGAVLASEDTQVAPTLNPPQITSDTVPGGICIMPQSGVFGLHKNNGKTYLIFQVVMCNGETATFYEDITEPPVKEKKNKKINT